MYVRLMYVHQLACSRVQLSSCISWAYCDDIALSFPSPITRNVHFRHFIDSLIKLLITKSDSCHVDGTNAIKLKITQRHIASLLFETENWVNDLSFYKYFYIRVA